MVALFLVISTPVFSGEFFDSRVELAEQSYAPAQHLVAWMYYKGDGVTQNYAEAVEWYHKAAAQGYTVAFFRLGWMYNNGLGVPENDKDAVK